AESPPRFVIQAPGPNGPSAHPGLGNVHVGRVGDGDPPPAPGPDLARPRGGGLAAGPAEAHAPRDDGAVARLLEVVPDLGGELLLGELHLDEGVVNGTAGDLAG